MEKLAVTIIPEDFRNAPNGYLAGFGLKGCVLQQALMRLYPDQYVQVSSHSLAIGKLPNQKRYRIDTEDWGRGSKPDGFSSYTIDYYSKKAKESLDGIPSKTIYLQEIDQTSGEVITELHNL